MPAATAAQPLRMSVTMIMAVTAMGVAATDFGAEPRRMNVAMIIADDLRNQIGQSRVPGTPQMHTPAIDSLADRGVLFAQTHAQVPTCAASRASFFTARYPDRTRVLESFSPYWRLAGGNFTSIPQYFKETGFESIGIGKLFHCARRCNNNYEVDGVAVQGPLNEKRIAFHEHYAGTDDIFQPPTPKPAFLVLDAADETNVQDQRLLDAAVATLQRLANRTEDGDTDPPPPFFLAVGFRQPHLPWYSPQRYYDLYPIENDTVPDVTAPANMHSTAVWATGQELVQYAPFSGDAELSSSKIQPGDSLDDFGDQNNIPNMTLRLRQAYFASVSFVDQHIGALIAEIDTQNFTDSTVVMFMGDHGFSLGEHGRWAKHSLAHVATHTPLIFVVPGITDQPDFAMSRRRVTAHTELLSVFPTLVDLATGATLPRCPSGDTTDIDLCTDADSLAPYIHGPHPSTAEGAGAAYVQYFPFPTAGTVAPHLTRCVPRRYDFEWPSGNNGTMIRLDDHPVADRACDTTYSTVAAVDGVIYTYAERVVSFQGSSRPPRARPAWETSWNHELYNITRDPLQAANVYSAVAVADPGLVAELQTILRSRIDVREEAPNWSGPSCPFETAAWDGLALGTTAEPAALFRLESAVEIQVQACTEACTNFDGARCATVTLFTGNASVGTNSTCTGFPGAQHFDVGVGHAGDSDWSTYNRALGAGQGTTTCPTVAPTPRVRVPCVESGLSGIDLFQGAVGMVPDPAVLPQFTSPDVGSSDEQADAASCAHACEVAPGCKSFVHDSAAASCGLYSASLRQYNFLDGASAELIPAAGKSFYRLFTCVPACNGTFEERRVRVPNARPKFATANIFSFMSSGLESCSSSCEQYYSCVSFTFVTGGAQLGKCQGYGSMYRNPAFQRPHATKHHYYVDSCILPCPATDLPSSSGSVAKFMALPGKRPIFASAYSVELSFASHPDEGSTADAELCATSCVQAGELACAAFTFLHDPAANKYGQCRHYPKAYGARFLTGASHKHYYARKPPRCHRRGRGP